MKKVIGLFVVTLLIVSAIPSLGMRDELKSTDICKVNNYQDCEFIQGEFIVKFTDAVAVTSVSLDVLNQRHQVSSMEKVFKNTDHPLLDHIYLFTVPEDADIESIVKEYALYPHVVYAEPNGIRYPCAVPNDEYFEFQWGLHNTGQFGDTPDADIDAPEAWDIETGDEPIVIAISDSGVDWDHPDLAANIWINEDEIEDGTDSDGNGFIDDIRGWDFVNDDNDPMDDYGHGTLCAGIAAAVGNNGIGITGVCWNCKIMPVKCLNAECWGSDVDCAQSIVYAVDNGADVISISWGDYPIYQLEEDAVKYAYSHGVVLVAGAGNDNTDEKMYPAGYDTVIAVAATDYDDKRPWWSNYGSWVDVAAPGEMIYTTSPDDDYTYGDGTSFSTPHVSGLAGLILSRDPSLSPEDVKSIICDNVDPYDSEEYIGTGRINAYKALSAINSPPDTPSIAGPTSGTPGTDITYTFVAVDRNDDDVSYYVDWGDGTTSEWTVLGSSGEDVELAHTWEEKGDYTIKAKAKDEYDAEGDWGELTVTMPKSKTINPLFLRIFERFPLLARLLHQII